MSPDLNQDLAWFEYQIISVKSYYKLVYYWLRSYQELDSDLNSITNIPTRIYCIKSWQDPWFINVDLNQDLVSIL